jgi:hypothetical protein
MKIIGIAICLGLCIGQTAFAQDIETHYTEVNSLTFSGELRSNRIPSNALGTFFEIPANCAKKPTAFIRSDTFAFPEASIGKIDSCSITYLLVQDTIQKIIIELPSEQSIKQAGKQAAKQFGKPAYHKEENTYVYSWDHTYMKKDPVHIRLEVNQDLVSGEMTIEPKE